MFLHLTLSLEDVCDALVSQVYLGVPREIRRCPTSRSFWCGRHNHTSKYRDVASRRRGRRQLARHPRVGRASCPAPRGCLAGARCNRTYNFTSRGSTTGRLDHAAMLMQAPQGGRLWTGRSQPRVRPKRIGLAGGKRDDRCPHAASRVAGCARNAWAARSEARHQAKARL
jgi:hypothetical protein